MIMPKAKAPQISQAKVRLVNSMINKGYRIYDVGTKKPYVFWLDILTHPWFPHLVFVKDKPEYNE